MPDDLKQKTICDGLFKGQIHQSKWKIVSWDKLKDFKSIEHLIEIVPFMLET